MKRIIGFAMFWIAVGMTIMMFIHSAVLSIDCAASKRIGIERDHKDRLDRSAQFPYREICGGLGDFLLQGRGLLEQIK